MSSSTFDTVCQMLDDVCEVDPGTVKPESNLIDDLGVDSLAFLDLTYEIDRKFGIKLPVQAWMEKVNKGEATIADYFVMQKLVDHIEQLASVAK